MTIFNLSGSMRYSMTSGSHYPSTGLPIDFPIAKMIHNQKKFDKMAYITSSTKIIPGPPGTLTVKYFQRVYDDGTAGYCYYTKTSIDATPSSGETSPNYTGAISDHSVVKILEIY